LAFGSLEVYAQRGEYQLVVELLEPRGLGALQLAFEQLKQRLGAEGLFDQARKRQLPRFPRKIGVTTSPSGAAIRDILRVIGRRFAGLHIVIAPCRVQGDGAGEEIAQAIADLNRLGDVDVIIAGRGGGSLEDLWAFNEEVVARAIAGSKIPVVSAVGHEVDVTIADLVADLRAPTPSAAAEMVVRSKEEMVERIASLRSRLVAAMRLLVAAAGDALEEAGSARARQAVRDRLRDLSMRLDDLTGRPGTPSASCFTAAVSGARSRRAEHMASTKKGSRQPGFEEALARLETIVKSLENGDLPLEESLRLFEEGVSLTRLCAAKLEEAQ